MLAQDRETTEKEVLTLTRKTKEAQATLDAILLRAAQADDRLTEGFMRLATQKQQEVALLRKRREQLEEGEVDASDLPLKIIELAQHLAENYVTFPPSQKRRVVESVFSNLWLADVNLSGEYRLPFAILADNARCPFNYPREDSNL